MTSSDDRSNDRSSDKAWREIVENYGDAPEFPDDTDRDSENEPDSGPEPEEPEEERFVPPPPPPVPKPTGIRLSAWLGVVLAPAILLVCLVASYALPTIVTALLVVWFLGGFGYLVWSLPRQRDDPWDDGAVL